MARARFIVMVVWTLGLAAVAACASKETAQTGDQRDASPRRDTLASNRATAERDVLAALDALHAAAARADGAAYFALFAPEAVFIGTDAAERWTKAEFLAYAEPYFAQGKGWTYAPRAGTRHVTFVPGVQGRVAFFEELLDNEKYGTCRGTGVARLDGGAWRVCQYHLTFPIPNDLAARFTGEIKAFERGER